MITRSYVLGSMARNIPRRTRPKADVINHEAKTPQAASQVPERIGNASARTPDPLHATLAGLQADCRSGKLRRDFDSRDWISSARSTMLVDERNEGPTQDLIDG